MRNPASVCLLAWACCLPGTATHAQPTPSKGTLGKMVILATVDGETGRREAFRTAKRLGLPFAMDTLDKVPLQRRYIGEVVTLHAAPNGKVVVSSFWGDLEGAKAALERAKRFFPRATMVSVPFAKDGGEVWQGDGTISARVLIVGSEASYPAAVRAAKAFSKRSGIAFDTRDLIFDKQRGLIWPDDYAGDPMYAGEYAPRRFDNCRSANGEGTCVSIERSEAYAGFRPDLFVLIAGIVGDDTDGKERLQAARKIVPSAYIKETVLYIGCTR